MQIFENFIANFFFLVKTKSKWTREMSENTKQGKRAIADR